ncbi:hypothetical protein [Demequina sp. NBRC 110056]|uniref:hypothetical protein n=1 Tax=Demequina sp. NBRC 110056 TaxID=1570345 RepID=UPI0009FC49CF|nr:hypothetical protein [Demequina sp. NBRC 110056]
MRAWGVVAGTAAGVAMALAGCTALSDEPASSGTSSLSAGPGAPAPSIATTAEIAFPRTLQADRKVEVRIASEQGDGFVLAASVTSPYFEGPMRVQDTVRVTPGFPARMRIGLGDAVCPAAEGDTMVEYEVAPPLAHDSDELAALAETGAASAVDEVLADINAVECRQRIATDAAAPSFVVGPEPADGQLATAVVLTRGPSEAEATLVGLTGNVIFSLDPVAGALPATLSAGQASAEVPVVVTATRCDAHAFAESKKTFVFLAAYEVGGERISVEYRAEGQVRDALQALFDACGEGSDSDGIGGQ